MRGQPRSAGRVLEAGAELKGQGGSHQAYAARALWRRVVEAPIGGKRQQPRRFKGYGQGLAAAAVREERGPRARGQKVREDHGPVFAAQEVALLAAE